MHPANSPPTMITLVLLSGLSVLSLNMFLPSLTNIADTYQADYALVTVSISGYLGITALLQLVMGPLSDRFGRRPVLLCAIGIFIVASVGCFLAPNVWLFLFFRLMQGAIIAGVVLSATVIRDMFPAQTAASKIGYVTMAWAIAPMLGPMFGGALDEWFGWRANFIVFIGLGIAILALCWADLGETNQNPSDTFAQQFKNYPALFRSRRFWGYALCMSFSTGAFYVFITGAPLVAQAVLSLSPSALGFYIGSITAGFILGNFLSGRFAQRFALTTMMIAGRIVAGAGLGVGLLLLLSGYINVYSMFGATVFVGVGNGLTMPGANTGAMSVRPNLAGSAAGLAGAMTVSIGALLTTFTGTAITESNGAYTLLIIMLSCVLIALAAAIGVWWIDRAELKTDNKVAEQ